MLTIKEINQNRTKLQKETFGAWVDAGFIGAIEWATGVGKTHVPTHHIIPAMNQSKPWKTTIVVVPKIVLKEDWEEKGGHIDKIGLKNVQVWVANSYVRARHRCDLLIVDEAHRFTNEEAEEFKKVILNTEFKGLLCMSATFSTEQILFMQELNIPIISRITTAEAERRGFVSPFRVFNLGLDLTEEDRKKEQELHDAFVAESSYFMGNMEDHTGNSFDRAKSANSSLRPRYYRDDQGKLRWEDPYCVTFAREQGWQGIPVEKAARNMHTRDMQSRGTKTQSIWEDEEDEHPYTPTKVVIHARQYMRAMHSRMDFLHNAKSKEEAVVELMRRTSDQTLLFSQRTAFADRITKRLGSICASYHSKIESRVLYDANGEPERYKSGIKKGLPKKSGKTVLKRRYKKLFEEKKLRALSTANSLDEGFNVEGISLAIITSSTGKKRQDVQRVGRAIRAQEGKVATIVNMYIKDSQDEKWLKDRQRGSKTPIWVDSIDEIVNYDSAIQFTD